MKKSLISPDANAASNTKPPRKQRWQRRLKRLGWLAVWLATAIALFYAIENWRGRRAWNAYVAKVNARGDSVDPAAVIPPPVPDAENFALAPIFLEIFEATYARKGRSKAETALSRLESSRENRTPLPGRWQRGEFVDLAAWQTFFRNEPEWPQTLVPQTPAENVVLGLSVFDGYLRELHEAKQRPYSRFPVRYEDAPVIIAPHYRTVRQLARLASLRSIARLAQADHEGAFEDLLLTFRLTESVGGEPIIMAALVRNHALSWFIQPLWEGMSRGEWTEDQLASVEKRLASVNLVRHFHSGLRSDRNLCIFPYFELFRRSPDHLLQDAGWKSMLRPSLKKMLGVWDSYPGMEASLDRIAGAILQVAPGGWYDQNKVTAGEWNDRIMDSLDPHTNRVHPDRVLALEKESKHAEQTSRSPYNFLELPNYSRALIQLGAMQGNLGLARIAIALERHRLRHGELPETLSGLEPEVVPAGGIPHDPASGTAPHYKRLSSDRFTLYFDGWNGKDDGGILGTQKDGPREPRLDPAKGDWVWPMPVNSAEATR